MSYDSFIVKEYPVLAANFANGFSRNIRGPFNRRARVRRVGLEVTTALTAGGVITLTSTMPTIPASPSFAAPPAPQVVFSWAVPASGAPAGVISDTLPNNVLKDLNAFDFILPANADLIIALASNGSTGVADAILQLDWF